MFGLFRSLGSSEAEVFGIKLYHQTDEWDKTLLGRTLWFIHRTLFKIENKYYMIKRIISLDHVIFLPIAGQYVDADKRMFIACFEILGDFVEKELGKCLDEAAAPDTSYKGYRIHSDLGTDQRAIDLWLWYKKELPQIEKEAHESKIYSVNSRVNYKYGFSYIQNLKNEKLKELMQIRESLWT